MSKMVDCTPTPQGMADMLIAIIQGDGPMKDKDFARKEIIKAFKISYAFWYPDNPEYKLDGYKIIKEVK